MRKKRGTAAFLLPRGVFTNCCTASVTAKRFVGELLKAPLSPARPRTCRLVPRRRLPFAYSAAAEAVHILRCVNAQGTLLMALQTQANMLESFTGEQYRNMERTARAAIEAAKETTP